MHHGILAIAISGCDLAGLQNETGGHRIMRIPPSEKRGRVQTSTVTVAVLDEFDAVPAITSDHDLRIEWFSGTGAGGQHRNKHQNSCRLIHITSGLVVTAQTRCRTSSEAAARDEMQRRLHETCHSNRKNHHDAVRKDQVGSGMRADKIRTYRFQDDVVKDHITGRDAALNSVMCGKFNLLW